ncbi:unnamed protein product [Clavelina lepadiformis]|uniref:Protein ABHD13 n=1 Tax=Clavelina lepadiformis TaxID=159417 RepID=A0ABP0FRP8_CLALP
MKLVNYFLSCTHIGYKRLTNSNSFCHSKLRGVSEAIGQLFCFCAYWAPFALLLLTVLYVRDDGIVPKFVLIPAIAVLILGVFYQAQDKLLYHPSLPENSRLYVAIPPPSVPFEVVDIVTKDRVSIHGYFLKQSGENLKTAPTFVCFHGNAGNAGSTSVMCLYTGCKVNVLTIDYRGYGRSSGVPSEQGLYLDALAAVEYLHSRTDIDLKKIVLHGHSLGGAVSIHLASRCEWAKDRISAVIVENTFSSIPMVASHLFQNSLPFLSLLPHFFFKNKFKSIEKVHDINVPALFICGDQDEIVPSEMSQMLYNTAGNPRSAFVTIPGGTHNDTWCVSPLYQISIVRFLNKVFESRGIFENPVNTEERIALTWEWQNDISPSRVL